MIDLLRAERGGPPVRPDEGSENSDSRLQELGQRVGELAESAKEGVERMASSLPVPPLPLLAPETGARRSRGAGARSLRKAPTGKTANRGPATRAGPKQAPARNAGPTKAPAPRTTAATPTARNARHR